MVGQTVVFDGHRLNDRFFVGSVAVGLPDFQPVLEDMAVGNGSVIRRMRIGTVSIDIRLVAKPVRGETAREALSDLCAWLDVDGPRKLALSSDHGLWRKCVPNGAPTIDDNDWDDKLTVHLVQVDPILYGIWREVTVPSGGTLRFVVGGDHPTKPTVVGSSVTRDATTSQWGVRLDGGDVLRVKLDTDSASTVSIDCDARTCEVNGESTIPTLDSDWLTLTCGMHEVTCELGGGGCVIGWYERWHR